MVSAPPSTNQIPVFARYDSGESPRELLRREPHDLCFVEREERLHSFQADASPGELRYSAAFAWVLDGLSTPIEADDLLLGSLRLGPLPNLGCRSPARWLDQVHASLLFSSGHMTLDHESVVREGLLGILAQAEKIATDRRSESARLMADNARMCITAIGRWVERYANSAETRMEGAAVALRHSPMQPARNFQEGLQACWTVHLVLSAVIGGRDFGFGRIDQFLWPLLKADLAENRLTRDKALALLRDFFFKLNWLAGNARGYPDERASFQPTPCTGSKQYLVLGGRNADGSSAVNLLSFLFLEAALQVRMREPVLHVRYDADADPEFRSFAVEVSLRTQGQVQFANERFTAPALIRRGVAPDDAWNYAASGCSRLDIGPCHGNGERWVIPTDWLDELVQGYAEGGSWPADFEMLMEEFSALAQTKVRDLLESLFPDAEPLYDTPFINGGGPHFHLESLFLRDCVEQSRHLCGGGGRYRLHLICFVGLATLVNSLAAIDQLIYREKSLTFAEFTRIVRADFAGEEALRQRIRDEICMFGNNEDRADDLTERVGNLLVDAVEEVPAPPGQITMGCFYSLIVHLWAGKERGATFDGRRAGQALSENQSADYGTDTAGMTALLNSLSRLPFNRAASGSLNLLFPSDIRPSHVQALLDTYFRQAGSMVGITVADRAQLLEAVKNPEAHRFLQVRLHGFSEYFVNLAPAEQLEVLQRTSAR